MYELARQRLESIYKRCSEKPLRGRMVGVEKECLRVAPDGTLSTLGHPYELGSALTHSSITTDFSEALLEMVTPPYVDLADTLKHLSEVQNFVYSKLPEGELLWATSMPCGLKLDSDVPIGRYGTSNIGHMKQVYRRGLGLRYGRKMQAIAGVHYNYSYPGSFWDLLREVEGKVDDKKPNSDFISDQYFALARNVLRFGWLIPYLFGASPAVCGSFFGNKGAPEKMQKHAVNTYYEPFATSLRMGDIGYQNNRDESTTVDASYNSVQEYVSFLKSAITTGSEKYQQLGLHDADGEYQQLNTNLLQIENEHYSSIRPKQITEPMEMPALAMERRGIRYVELRSLDVNAYDPLGINEEQLRFLEAFMLFCMLCESPPMNASEQLQNKRNLIAVAHRGRDPELMLERGSETVSLRQWGSEILDMVGELCDLLDVEGQPKVYCNSLTQQLQKLNDAALTPSGMMLQELFDNEEDFFTLGMRKSREHYEQSSVLSAEQQQQFEQLAADSHKKQAEIEASDKLSFEEFLRNYSAQLPGS